MDWGKPSSANHDDDNARWGGRAAKGVGSKGPLHSIKGGLASDHDSILLTSLSCNHDSLRFIYLATKRGRYPLRQTAMYTLHYSVCTDLGLGHTANAC